MCKQTAPHREQPTETVGLVFDNNLYDNSMELCLTARKYFALNILCENFLRIYKIYCFASYNYVLLFLTCGLGTLEAYGLNSLSKSLEWFE